MKQSIYILLLLATSIFAACSKEDKPRRKLVGEYKFYHYEVDYFNGDAGKDSTFQLDDVGTLKLSTENKSGSEWYNETEYTSSKGIPKGWLANSINTTVPFWNTDQGTMKTINFFVEPNPGNVRYVCYSIDKIGHNKYIFSYVSTAPNGQLNYVERMYLKQK